jgi:hypothetical protein
MLSKSDTDSPSSAGKNPPGYLSLFLLNILLICALVAVFNLIVDPAARTLLVDKPGFNQVKIGLPANSRKGKANVIRQCDYDAIVLGSSDAETGIAVAHPALSKKKAYNAALRGGSPYEIRRMVEYALQHQKLKGVVLGLDFSTFNSRVLFLDDFADSPLAETVSLDSLARYLFSLRTFTRSVETLRWNAQANAADLLCSDNGEHKGSYEIPAARKTFDFILGKYGSDQYSNYVPGDLHFQHLAILLQELIAADVAVYAFISPSHFIQLELITEMGLIDEYEDWQRQLVRVFTEANRNVPEQRQAVLWDFAGYSQITTEKVPSLDGEKFMHWYTDPVHYNQNVGNLMLDYMFGLQPDEGVKPLSFGTRLTAENIEAVIEDQQRDSERYRRENPEEIVHLQETLGPLSSEFRLESTRKLP